MQNAKQSLSDMCPWTEFLKNLDIYRQAVMSPKRLSCAECVTLSESPRASSVPPRHTYRRKLLSGLPWPPLGTAPCTPSSGWIRRMSTPEKEAQAVGSKERVATEPKPCVQNSGDVASFGCSEQRAIASCSVRARTDPRGTRSLLTSRECRRRPAAQPG